MKNELYYPNLRELLDSVKLIEGFPNADIENIIYLSNPPEYTACPNPYIKAFINQYGTKYNANKDKYVKKPFIKDVREGKHNPIYLAHTYHTKLPHQAIQQYIEHYTNPGDIIFDGFSGSGMVGIAAALSNRKAILSDISPFATNIAYNYANCLPPDDFLKIFNEILNKVKFECDWMYNTRHSSKSVNTRTKQYVEVINGIEKFGSINYIVWNDVYECPSCNNEICFGETFDEKKPGEYCKKFNCPHCKSIIHENDSEKVYIMKYDDILETNIKAIKEKPILINYSIGKKHFWKKPENYDFHLINEIENLKIPYWVPRKKMPNGWSTTQTLKSHNITHVHHYFTKRNLYIISKFLDLCKINDFKIWFIFSSLLQKASKLMALNKDYIGRVTKGVLYISSIRQEINIFYFLKKNITFFKQALKLLNFKKKIMISTQSTSDLSNIPSNTIDYIFIDPPFGGNIMYSELNFIWESFLKVFTNIEFEAIENKTQGKTLQDYSSLMVRCFIEMFRILKPKRWITIVFHNSKASVWNAIQKSIRSAGFIISQVSVLDKKIGSFKQITGTNSVKNDLIINAFKPEKSYKNNSIQCIKRGFEIEFLKKKLKNLPIQPNISRTSKMLFSKTLAYYVENNLKITYNSNDFYKILKDNFVELDGYWYLEEQINKFQKLKE